MTGTPLSTLNSLEYGSYNATPCQVRQDLSVSRARARHEAGWSGHGVSAVRRYDLLEEALGLAPRGLQDDDDSNAAAIM